MRRLSGLIADAPPVPPRSGGTDGSKMVRPRPTAGSSSTLLIDTPPSPTGSCSKSSRSTCTASCRPSSRRRSTRTRPTRSSRSARTSRRPASSTRWSVPTLCCVLFSRPQADLSLDLCRSETSRAGGSSERGSTTARVAANMGGRTLGWKGAGRQLDLISCTQIGHSTLALCESTVGHVDAREPVLQVAGTRTHPSVACCAACRSGRDQPARRWPEEAFDVHPALARARPTGIPIPPTLLLRMPGPTARSSTAYV